MGQALAWNGLNCRKMLQTARCDATTIGKGSFPGERSPARRNSSRQNARTLADDPAGSPMWPDFWWKYIMLSGIRPRRFARASAGAHALFDCRAMTLLDVTQRRGRNVARFAVTTRVSGDLSPCHGEPHIGIATILCHKPCSLFQRGVRLGVKLRQFRAPFLRDGRSAKASQHDHRQG